MSFVVLLIKLSVSGLGQLGGDEIKLLWLDQIGAKLAIRLNMLKLG